jgi:hypothetical protein
MHIVVFLVCVDLKIFITMGMVIAKKTLER